MSFDLTTRRLHLRPVGPADAAELHALWTAPAVRRHLWNDRVIPTEQTTDIVATSEQFFRDRRFGLWGAWPHAGGDLLGFAGLWYFRDPPELELLFGVAQRHWRNGYAVEMGRAVTSYAHTALAMDRVQASTDADNVASVRVLEKLGFRLLRQAIVEGLDTLYFECAADGRDA